VPEYIAKAYELVRYNNLVEEERAMIDYAAMSSADAAAHLDYALEQGRAQGVEQGLERGRAQGVEWGLERGRAQGGEWGLNEETLHIARNALSEGLPVELIGTITGLSPDAIRRLQENN
jgi:predicted transposase YdaD